MPRVTNNRTLRRKRVYSCWSAAAACASGGGHSWPSECISYRPPSACAGGSSPRYVRRANNCVSRCSVAPAIRKADKGCRLVGFSSSAVQCIAVARPSPRLYIADAATFLCCVAGILITLRMMLASRSQASVFQCLLHVLFTMYAHDTCHNAWKETPAYTYRTRFLPCTIETMVWSHHMLLQL